MITSISNIIIKKLFIFLSLGFLLIKGIFAQEVKNNKFGIHLAQPHFEDLPKVAEMVNGSGGDWGYVTLVIQENDRNLSKWQEIFDRLRELRLIPIIRLATSPQGENWRRPSMDDVESWVNFLDSLNWVVKNRYVVLFNEPNHAKEWGGAVDVENYAQIAFTFAKALKEKNTDFFVMLAGFDASAPSRLPYFEDEEIFLKKMFLSSTSKGVDIFNLIDGWASHSYPNPNFSGSPWDSGRGTVKTYQWELNLLRQLGLMKDLPVFITETGWKRDVRYLLDINQDKIAQNFKIAFENVWLPDERIMAVTPFVFDYQSDPFLGFSFKKPESFDFYPQYYTLKEVKKVAGEPIQIEKGKINFNLPKKIVFGSSYNFSLNLKNQGQSIWNKDNYQLILKSDDEENYLEKTTEVYFANLPQIKPKEEAVINFFLKTNITSSPKSKKEMVLFFALQKKEKEIFKSSKWQLTIIPAPSLKFKVVAFPAIRVQNYQNYQIQIFDKNENLIYKKKPVKVEKAVGFLTAVENVILGERYRVVVLRDYYLPRQNFITFKEAENYLTFKIMLPLDFNLDGKFDLTDIFDLIKKIIK